MAKRNSGITLVEVLIIIGVMVVLLIVGGVFYIRKRIVLAKNAVCLANLKSLHTSCVMYQEEYNGANPSAMQGYMKALRYADGKNDEERINKYSWPVILAKSRLHGMSEKMDSKMYRSSGCPSFRKPDAGEVSSEGSLNSNWPQWLASCYGMAHCNALPDEHNFTFAVYQVDRVPQPGALMMLEDKHADSSDGNVTQPDMNIESIEDKSRQPNMRRGMMASWSNAGSEDKLNDGPHAGKDNIVFFDGHGITVSPQEIYEEEYWLMPQ